MADRRIPLTAAELEQVRIVSRDLGQQIEQNRLQLDDVRFSTLILLLCQL